MKPGRNEPCSCGSGKKYKHCCAARDASASPLVRAIGAETLGGLVDTARGNIGAGAPWEADVVPLPMIADDPTARPVGTLVAADGFVVHMSIDSHPASELSHVVQLLERGIRAAMADLKLRPGEVLLRDAAVAEMIGRRLEPDGIRVRHERVLPTVRELSADMVANLAGRQGPAPLLATAQTWAAWRVPNDIVARLFAAAAAFHRARPWVKIGDDQLLDLELPSGRRWSASVLGGAGAEFGLSLFEDRADFERLLTATGPGDAFAAMASMMLSVSFDPRDVLPKSMVREVSRANWELSAPNAYPTLFALNTPGGAVPEALFEDLIESLGVVERFVAANGPGLMSEEQMAASLEWVDAEHATRVTYVPPEYGPAGPWPQIGPLTPALPQGEHADPASALAVEIDLDELDEANDRVIDRFEESLRGVPQTRADRDLDNVGFLVGFASTQAGIPLAAFTEYDLREFLYDWFPRKVRMSRAHAMSIRGSLRRFFDFLATQEGIAYPWAGAILAAKELYEFRWDSFPGGFFWDPAVRNWASELTVDLHERAFLPVSELAGVGEWGETMGSREARLYHELHRRWLIWRDEVIRAGTTDAATVRELLAQRQREWETRPGAAGPTTSPSQEIANERKSRPVPDLF